jgi:hypothetical protein
LSDGYQNYLSIPFNFSIEISKRFAALENLDESFDIHNAWEYIKENIKTSAKDTLRYQTLKHNKS